MSKYKIYKNRRTKFHPSIEIESNKKIWKNLEITKHPTSSGKYIKLSKNPSGQKGYSYVRKYLRKDPIRTRGQELKKYCLSNEDELIIDDYLKKKS